MKQYVNHWTSRRCGVFLGLLITPFWLLFCCETGGGSSSTPTPPAVSFAGKYQLTSAKLNEGVSDAEFEDEFTKGKDVSDITRKALGLALACEQAKNLVIDLREDQKMYFSCEGEADSKQTQKGTWAATDNNKTVSLNLAADGGNIPFPYTITIADAELDSKNVLSGNSKLPAPKWILKGLDGPTDEYPTISVITIDVQVMLQQF